MFCWQLPFSLPLILLESLYPSCDEETETLQSEMQVCLIVAANVSSSTDEVWATEEQ